MPRVETVVLLGALGLMLWGPPLHAEGADRREPVHVEADSVRIDDLQKTAVYEGRVVLTQGTLRVQADRIELRQDAEGFVTGIALGRPAQFRQRLEGRGEWVDARANRVEYDDRRQQVRLIGEAFLRKGEEELRGELITYDARTEQYQASGTLPGQRPGRVQAVILPFSDQAGNREGEAGGVSPAGGGR